MKKFYTVEEIASSKGVSVRYIQEKAKAENWKFELEKNPKGKGRAVKAFYSSTLPKDIKDAVIKSESDRLLESLAPAPAPEESYQEEASNIIVLHAPKVKLPSPRMPSMLAPYNKEGVSDVHALKGWQKDTATARLTFVKFLQNHPKSQRQGIIDLLVMQNQGTLPAHLAQIVAVANNRSGRNALTPALSQREKEKTEERGLSERTLKRWASDYAKYGYMGIVPESPNKEVAIPAWAAEFLTLYRKPSKPAINFVLELMA